MAGRVRWRQSSAACDARPVSQKMFDAVRVYRERDALR